MAGIGERGAFLRFPIIFPHLFGIGGPFWAGGALHAAGEVGRAKRLVDRHILLHLQGFPGGHEGFQDFCRDRKDKQFIVPVNLLSTVNNFT